MKMCPLATRRVGGGSFGQDAGNREQVCERLTAHCYCCDCLCMNGTLRCSAQTSGTPTTKSKLASVTKLFYDG